MPKLIRVGISYLDQEITCKTLNASTIADCDNAILSKAQDFKNQHPNLNYQIFYNNELHIKKVDFYDADNHLQATFHARLYNYTDPKLWFIALVNFENHNAKIAVSNDQLKVAAQYQKLINQAKTLNYGKCFHPVDTKDSQTKVWLDTNNEKPALQVSFAELTK